MSTLPDLSTQDPGLVAFWNAIEQSTVDSIDPSEVTSDGNVQSQTIYDNGIEGEYATANPNSNCHYRVKTDGWIIAYLDTVDNAEYGANTNNVHGQFDFIDGVNQTGNFATNENTLERAIKSLASQLSNWSTIDNYYNKTDVGVYSFDWASANGVSAFSISARSDGGTTYDKTVGIIPTAGTTVRHFSVYGDSSTTSDGDSLAKTSFEGNEITDTPRDASRKGARDMLPLLGGSLNEGQEYTGTAQSDDADDLGAAHAYIGAILIWE
jgi:hypothetical protein